MIVHRKITKQATEQYSENLCFDWIRSHSK